MPEAGKISINEQEEIDTDMLRDRPFYHILINSLDVYDFPKQGKFMKIYNGLMGKPDGYNKTAKYVCWDKTIFSRKLITWNLKEGKETGDDGKLVPGEIDMTQWGDVADKYRNKIDLSVPVDFSKLFYCLTMKLFLFPIPQVLFIATRFVCIFLNIIGKALVIIIASICNTLNSLANKLISSRVGMVFGGPIIALNYILVNVFKAIFDIIAFFTKGSSKLVSEEIEDKNTGEKITQYGFTYKTVVNVDGTGEEITVIPTFADVIYSYLGLVLPIGSINPQFGVKYGNGGLGILILLIMCVSAVVIFVGGSSITVAFVGFLMYIFKVVKMLGDFKTEDTGKSSKTASSK